MLIPNNQASKIAKSKYHKVFFMFQMEFFKCNETYFCNVTTHYKTFGSCPEYTDCVTYPCDVRSCKPHFEPVPGYCQEIECYFKEEPDPDPKPNGNG